MCCGGAWVGEKRNDDPVGGEDGGEEHEQRAHEELTPRIIREEIDEDRHPETAFDTPQRLLLLLLFFVVVDTRRVYYIT